MRKQGNNKGEEMVVDYLNDYSNILYPPWVIPSEKLFQGLAPAGQPRVSRVKASVKSSYYNFKIQLDA